MPTQGHPDSGKHPYTVGPINSINPLQWCLSDHGPCQLLLLEAGTESEPSGIGLGRGVVKGDREGSRAGWENSGKMCTGGILGWKKLAPPSCHPRWHASHRAMGRVACEQSPQKAGVTAAASEPTPAFLPRRAGRPLPGRPQAV